MPFCDEAAVTPIEGIVPRWSAATLEEQNRWMCWKDYNGRKVPCSPHGSGTCDATNPRNWTDLWTATAAAENYYYDGVGFAIGDGVVGIDLDDCREPVTGTLTTKAQEIVQRLASYTEVSPSGRGLHIFVLAKSDVNRRLMRVEIYSRSRYFTVTGLHVPGTPDDLQERTAELTALCKDLFGSSTQGCGAPFFGPPRRHNLNDDDEALLQRAHEAANGAKFGDLFAGRWRGYGYPSQSEADLALCCLLAFWTDDADQIERLFRRSGLMRPKFDDPRGPSTYGARTIRLALR